MASNKNQEAPAPGHTTADFKPMASAEKLEIEDSGPKKEDSEAETQTAKDCSGGHSDDSHSDDDGEEDEEDEQDEAGVVDLDSVLSGGCSTCGSKDHDEDVCEEDADPAYMMSTALPPSGSSSS